MSSRLIRSIATVTALVVALTSAGLPLAGFSPTASLPDRNAGCRCSLNRILSGTCCCSRKAEEGGGCCSRPESQASPSKSKPPVGSCCSKPVVADVTDKVPADQAPATKPGCQCQPEETSIVAFPPVPRWDVIALPTPHADPSLDVREVRSDVCSFKGSAPETPPPRFAV